MVQVYYPNAKRKCGWVYDEHLRIFQLADKFKIAMLKKNKSLIEVISPDLHELDSYQDDEIPVGKTKILNLQSGKYRERQMEDGATFYLLPPYYSTVVDVYLDAVISDEDKRFLKQFLLQCLQRRINNTTLVIKGFCNPLFVFFTLLDPLLHCCDPRLLYRGDIGPKLLDTIKGKRLIYSDIKEKYFRRCPGLGHIPICVHCADISGSNTDKILEITVKEGKDLPAVSSPEVLAWLLK